MKSMFFKPYSKRAGFTLTELALITVVMGIFTILVLARFIDLTSKSYEANEEATAGNIRSGIEIYYVERVTQGYSNTYPYSLDNASTGNAGVSNLFFSEVLEHGIADSNWEKMSGNRYKYKPTDHIYRYQSSGNFMLQ